jgi:cytochrome c-type biogenesis protein CcmF
VGFYFALFMRRKELRSPYRLESVVSRESGFLLNNWVFMALLFLVFFGTLWPVITESLTGNRLTLGPSFFNVFAGPLSLILLFLTGVGPLIAWRRATLANIRKQFAKPGLFALALGLVLGAIYYRDIGYWTISCWTLSAFVVATIVQEYYRAIGGRVRNRGESVPRAFATLMQKNQRRYGGYVVHLGIVLVLLGISGTVFNQEKLENLTPGGSAELQNLRLEYLTAESIPAQHYGGAKARIALYRDGGPLAVMTPEKRQYWLEEQPVSIPSIYSTLREDIYVVLTGIESDGSATIKIYRNPLVNWLWVGLGIFIIGSLIVMWPTPVRPIGTPQG